KNVQPVTVYDDQIDDSVYKRDQKSKWTRVRKADKHEVDDVKRTRNEEASERLLTFNSSEFTPLVDSDGKPLPKSERKPKRKVAVMIGYCGTGYNGMQLQNDPKIPTIERDLYEAFAAAGAVSPENAMDIKKSGFMRAARTDKGVHAAGNVISLKLIIEDPEILAKINEKLPDQIRIWGIQRVTKSFDCRKMCSSRVYEYLLPTYSLLPPKPKTVLSDLVVKKRSEEPGVLRDDEEGDVWWKETRKAILEEGPFTEEELDDVQNQIQDETVSTKTYDENGSITEFGKIIRAIKNIENKRRRAYTVSTERLELFRQAMKQYEGTHNFHNFTIGKAFKDPSSKRFMKETTVSDPFIIEGTEWVSIKIHGQSFMLHQIRKMIAMAVLVIRTGCPISRIHDCFSSTKINIPKAPALGLLLENPVYEAYNQTLQKNDYEPIDFDKYEAEMDKFKMKYIYDKIYAEENKENVFYGFFGFIDTF
ncbi:predicted protein, partial [Scheffersomyces stipitis CBS 6054]